jgi:hypothetical protein
MHVGRKVNFRPVNGAITDLDRVFAAELRRRDAGGNGTHFT